MIAFLKGISNVERAIVLLCVTGIVGTLLFWSVLGVVLVNAI
jgi:hypothetical protein|tara:strand:+ start:390 stop:515 length:126 start_codon:yes stop_codon:yes gene_type:complete